MLVTDVKPRREHMRLAKYFAFLLTAALIAGAQEPAQAQKYPNRPVHIVNTFPAGGSGDAVLRIVFDKVGLALDQPFVIETRAGASGAIGTDFVARAAPDGYTFVLGTASTFGTNSSTQTSLPYDPITDFTPVILMARTPYFLLINPSVKADTLAEYVSLVKANPGKFNFGSFGAGSSNQLAYELLKYATGMDVVHVPYKGGAPLITALLSGEIQSSMDVYGTSIQYIRAGKMRVLGVASAERFSLLPEVPTLKEQGYDVEGGTFFALLGPANLPAQVVEIMNREVSKALTLPEVRKKLAALGVEPVSGSPEELASAVSNEVKKWAQLVKVRNLKFN
ncbi:MAG: tripartite tricarboxylate transporter substrate binding protein [Variovorax sp.]